jgi:LuxR family quorum sensing-dependent transcriptional regulator
VLSGILARAEAAFQAPTPQEASALFFRAFEGLGATYLQTRLYRRPTEPLTSATHWAAGGVVSRIAVDGWVGSAAFDYICLECNPLLTAIREGRTRYRFSDFAPRDDLRYATYWDAFSEARIYDALCATSYGPDGLIASLHLGFGDVELDAEQSLAVQVAGLVLTERLMTFADGEPSSPPVQLTCREHDTLALVADGKTDWEISVILGITQATARFHVDNGRRKLGAVTRAQAVARMVNQRLIWSIAPVAMLLEGWDQLAVFQV